MIDPRQSSSSGGVRTAHTMNILRTVLLSGSLLLGGASCGATKSDPGPSGPGDAPPPRQERILVRVTGEHHAPGGKPIPLVQNGVVKSGDEYSLVVELSRPAYVHLAEMHPKGGGTTLYPIEGDPREPLAIHKVPAPADVLFFNDDVGPEVLLLVVTERPLADAAPELYKTLADIERSPADPTQIFTLQAPALLPDDASATASGAPAAPTTSAPPAASSAPVSAVGEIPRKAWCPPLVVAKVEMSARGDCGGKAEAKITSKGSGRRPRSGELVRAVVDEAGLLTFPIVLDHQ